MANTTNLQHTCGEYIFRNHTYCVKSRLNVRPSQYACNKFMTDEEYIAEREKINNQRMARNEMRLNFILTALEISATATQQIMEYFDSLFEDHMVERNWRFERKKAAKDIRTAAEKMRQIYQYSFMKDHMTAMTAHGTKAFDAQAYDSHEKDGRNFALKLFYDLDRCWQNDENDKAIIDHYKSMVDNNCFDESDYRHFAK